MQIEEKNALRVATATWSLKSRNETVYDTTATGKHSKERRVSIRRLFSLVIEKVLPKKKKKNFF